MIDKFLQPITGIIDKLVPDKTKKMELEHAIKTQMFELSKQQNEVNLAQAKHGSIFVAGARPAIMWICALGLFWSFFLAPLLNWGVVVFGVDIQPPTINTEGLMTLTLSLLGLGSMRSYEKAKGVARNNMREENTKDAYKP
ncbi:MAG: hypothetical protein CMK23_08135 [Porticoccaceae bacterium]|nr:hypothetical protein [Porticoccaceae bacterium]|tara:strand:- start:12010 stop:12432 length:423 start_codon:yes stop_codon:yes gene_type:complete